MKRLFLSGTLLAALLAPAIGKAATISIDPSILNPSFEASTGATCPTSWTCGGSPGSGFGTYAVTSAQYTPGADGLPFNLVTPAGSNAAYSPTGLSGSGTLQQTTSLIYTAGNTYTFDFWIGLPKTEPDGTTAINGYPDTVRVAWLTGSTTDNLCGNGSATLQSLTGASYSASISIQSGSGNACQFNIPSPGAGQWQEFELSFNDLYVNSGNIGAQFFDSASSTGQPKAINVDIGTPAPIGGGGSGVIPEPASLTLFGFGVAALGLFRRRRRH
jgi:hypothetical protein